ncbi:MAG: radical SAM protein [Candidatus Aenigmarchaeota archaeon]|nr:radical SAM protein [Candidatus Aenigmarchaeota archaeon]
MNEKIDRLVSWMNGKKTGPLSLEIWPTNRCNLRCKMCGTWASRRKAEEKGLIYNPEEERKRELPDEIWLKIIDDAIELGVKEFLITGGGESLIRKETTLKLIKKIKECGAYGTLNTNGTLFSTQDVPEVISTEWDMIIFSIDGPDAETHDFIRNVKGTFNRVKKVLLEFKKQKKKLRVDKPKIVFNTVVLNKNFKKFLQLMKFAKTVDCEDITFIPLIAFDKSIEEFKLNPIEKFKLSKMISKIDILSERFGIHTNIHEFKEKQISDIQRIDKAIKGEIELFPQGFTSLPCYEPFLHLLINPEGRTSCCCMLAGKSIKGDFLVRSLKDIWFGEWFNSLREQFLRKELPEDCSTCVFSQFIRNKQIREELKRNLFKEPI